ncbi:hypothetical protein ACFVZM_08985 [Streptomyces sioyaensis]|uniref:hypothetical protein n=1 Tax=Streptomyces sioyaensis TaxID=67364 RepID=UPI0036957393
MTMTTYPADEDSSSTDPVRQCHEVLKLPGMAALTHEELVTGQRDAGLTHGDRLLTHVLRPRLVLEADQRTVAEAGRLVARAARRLAANLAAPDTDLPAVVCESISLDRAQAALARIPHPGQEPSMLGRLDGFGNGEHVMFVEYNADSAAGLVTQDLLTRIYADTCTMRQLDKTTRIQPAPTLERIVDLLLAAWHDAGEPGATPQVAVVDWPDRAVLYEFQPVRAALQARGVPTLICTPDDLSFTRGRLMAHIDEAGNQPVTLVYRRVMVTDLRHKYGPHVIHHPLVRAAMAGACTVVNPLAAQLTTRKSLFALLSDEQVLNWLPADEAAAARRHVPWSRQLRPGRTLYQGDTVDLLEFVRTQRDRLVLKPDDGYAGRGVVCGWHTSPDAWSTAIKNALRTPHVVQERVPIPTAVFPFLADKGLVWHQRLEGNDPMLVGDTVAGSFSRISTNFMVNMASGGHLLPGFTTAPLHEPTAPSDSGGDGMPRR